eukprot:358493-Chlamydomonas_euryale.AAC.1
MMRSTRYYRIGCSVEVAFGRQRAEGGCGSSKERYQVYVLSNIIQGVEVEVAGTSLLGAQACWVGGHPSTHPTPCAQACWVGGHPSTHPTPCAQAC